ncbi:MAG: preprotein translocase subunit SecG [Ruthenibacterium lactatiformans]
MGVLEIISGVLLILCSIAIIVMVLFQESKGNGLSVRSPAVR